ncbi:hypothetical protein O181_037408 [Austropuccinia psidii MF-1]|uniref:Uncharacterized protein n=1 Tax=Austropuccinia psidii MF-1 TaxID=1389203 RepID=A0A9Q3HA28_9BASI|nr:hypothetical protein [Austropuccinia psidii MF-1]
MAVEGEILSFLILTEFPEEFHSLIENVMLKTNTQENPNAILNKLHEATLKKEVLSTDSNKALVLKKVIHNDHFLSKIIHYCSNRKHTPLVTTHGPEKCWQLHPELQPERKQREKEQNENFTIA